MNGRSARWTIAVAAVIASVGAIGLPTARATAAPASASIAAGPSAFRPLSPTRVLDTRSGLGAPAGKPGPGSTTVVTIAGVAGVSDTASAVALNVTATEATAPGFVQVFPTGGGVPGVTSNLNVEQAGGTVANLVVVKVGANGTVSLYTQTGAHLVADVLGFFEATAAAQGGRFVPLPAPTRLLDTRDPSQVPIANPGDAVNCSSFTTWAEANRWFWTYHRYGDVAHLDQNGDGVPCESLPGAPSAAKIPVDLFKLAAGGILKAPITTSSTLPGGTLPVTASAVVLNLTATESPAGFLQVLPTGRGVALGSSSNLNVTAAGQTIANGVIVPVGIDGTVTIYSQAGAHVVVDIAGYFTGPTDTLSTDGLFVPTDPTRLLDTRNGTGAPAFKLGAGGLLSISIGGANGVPLDASNAAFLNVTITEATAPGFVQVLSTCRATPGATSNLNVEQAGQTRPNAVFVGVGIAGLVSLYTQSGGHLLADLAGYFTAGDPVAVPPGQTGSPAQALASLTIAPEDFSVAYNRADWGYPADLDGDCQDTRAEVLIRDSLASATFNQAGCTVIDGDWLDPYTGLSHFHANELEIDHLVPLADAHRSGGAAWSAAKKAAYANDVTGDELEPTASAVNQAKGDSAPDVWLPPDPGAHCAYVITWIGIKARWGLTVTQAEHDTLASILAGC